MAIVDKTGGASKNSLTRKYGLGFEAPATTDAQERRPNPRPRLVAELEMLASSLAPRHARNGYLSDFVGALPWAMPLRLVDWLMAPSKYFSPSPSMIRGSHAGAQL